MLDSRSPSALLCAVAVVLLLAAATLKWEQLPVVDRFGDGLMYQSSFVLALITVEVALALWFVFGIWPSWSRWVPAAFFAGLAGVALYQTLSGAASCGCFGRLRVNPWITFGMDVALAAALMIWPPHRPLIGASLHLGLRVAAIASVLSIVIGLTLRRLPARPSVQNDAGFVQAGSLTILEPQMWIGGPFTLGKYIDIAPRISSGNWTLVLYRWDCGHCREVIPHFERQARRRAHESDLPAVALIEIPPYAPAGQDIVQADSTVVTGKLSDAEEWFAATPVVLELKDGIVISAQEGKDVDKLVLADTESAQARPD